MVSTLNNLEHVLQHVRSLPRDLGFETLGRGSVSSATATEDAASNNANDDGIGIDGLADSAFGGGGSLSRRCSANNNNNAAK